MTNRQMWKRAIRFFSVAVVAWLTVTGCGQGLDKQPLVWRTIQEAATRGDLADVKRHLARGEAVNSTGEDGITPLFAAAESGKMNVVEYLISKGADVKVKNANGNAVLGQEGDTPLHGAATCGHADLAGLLITKGADVDARGIYDETPLIRAATNGHADVVGLLIAKGADVNAENFIGGTALGYAERKGHADVVELLRKHGGRPPKEEDIRHMFE